MKMSQWIFVVGFTRGGTTWLRDCVGSHPDVVPIGPELPVIRDLKDPTLIKNALEDVIGDLVVPYYVTKAPANSLYLKMACDSFPDSRFLFIIRDPRDVFVSHKRSTLEWTMGKNKKIDGCMDKIEKYYRGYEEADCKNLMLVKYEDLHQKFASTMKTVFDFIGLPYDDVLLEDVYQRNKFVNKTKRITENKDSHFRKGAIGEWGLYLDDKEIEFYKTSEFWESFMERHEYGWDKLIIPIGRK